MTAPQPLNYSLVDITKHIISVIESNKNTIKYGAVYYGDQVRIAKTPAICVEPAERRNIPKQGGGRFFDCEVEISVIIYHSKVESTQQSREEVDSFGAAVELVLNKDRFMLENGHQTVINSYVSSFQSGYIERQNGTMRACRITLSVLTRIMLPS